jgi:hypothetical protein
MSIRTLKQVIVAIGKEPVAPNCKVKLGQKVLYTNNYGVTFGPHKIIGFCKGDGLLFKYGRHIYLDFDSYWCPVAESGLEVVP